MESYLSFYDWLVSLNITVPFFIHLPANVKTSTLVKTKINRLRVCKFTLSHCLLIQGLNHSPSFHLLSLSIDERWHFFCFLGRGSRPGSTRKLKD